MTMCLFRKVSKTKLSTARYILRENIREQHPTLPIPKNSYCTAENILTRLWKESFSGVKTVIHKNFLVNGFASERYE